jgi:hypothetical protein
MTDDEAFERLKTLGCNYMEPCVDLNHIEKIKSNVRLTYMTDLETYLFPAEFSGSSKKSCITLSDSKSISFDSSPKGIQ